MNVIKKGDMVARKSYGKDIIFYVKKIIKTKKENIAILCGLLERIEADSKIEDLEIIDEKTIKDSLQKHNEKVEKRINKREEKYKMKIIEEKSKGVKIKTKR